MAVFSHRLWDGDGNCASRTFKIIMADSLNRAFLIQVPPVLIAILLVQWRLHLPNKHEETDQSKWEKLKRVDFIGATFLCFTIFAAAFVIDSGGQKLAWDSAPLIGLIVAGAVSAILFVISAKYVREPIFPLRLIAHYATATSYLIVWLQVMVQMSLMMAVPLYFQATRNASTAAAGAYLVPAFVGNTLGGLLAGYWIRRTGRYKWPTVFAPILSVGCLVLCLLTWNGDTSIPQALFILPGGFATGMISSSAFVGMAAGVSAEDIAIAGSGMYVFFNIGAISGASAGGAVYQTGLKAGLEDALHDVKGGEKVCKKDKDIDMNTGLTYYVRYYEDCWTTSNISGVCPTSSGTWSCQLTFRLSTM